MLLDRFCDDTAVARVVGLSGEYGGEPAPALSFAAD